MVAIFEQVLILLIFCLAGYVLCKTKLIDPDHSKALSVLLVYVFLPCTLFNSFSKQFTVVYLAESWPLMLTSVGLIPVVVIVAKIINRFITKNPEDKAPNEYSMSMANIGYMGYPLAESVFGSVGLLDCMMFALPMQIYIGTIGFNMLTAGKEKKSLLKKIFTPSLIGILIGCAVGISGIKLPQIIYDAAQKSGACMAPVSMILTGMIISKFPIKELLACKTAYIISTVRLVIAPLMIFGLLKLCNLEFALDAAVLLYAMPCGMNAIVYPKLVGNDSKQGAAAVMISTVLSMVTIPVCLHFLLT